MSVLYAFINLLLKFRLVLPVCFIKTKFALSLASFIVHESIIKSINLVSLFFWTGWFQTASDVRKITGTDPSSPEINSCHILHCSV